MSQTLNFADEMAYIASPEFVLGQYLYLGQVKTADGKTALLSAAYKPNYALRKMQENFAALQVQAPIAACYLRKIRVGETDDCGKIMLPLELLSGA